MGRAEAAGAKNAEMASASFPFSLPLALELDLKAAPDATGLLLRVSPAAGRIRLSVKLWLISLLPRLLNQETYC